MKIGFIKVEFEKAEDEEPKVNNERPVRFVPDGVNSWRVVYAD